MDTMMDASLNVLQDSLHSSKSQTVLLTHIARVVQLIVCHAQTVLLVQTAHLDILFYKVHATTLALWENQLKLFQELAFVADVHQLVHHVVLAQQALDVLLVAAVTNFSIQSLEVKEHVTKFVQAPPQLSTSIMAQIYVFQLATQEMVQAQLIELVTHVP
jgi:hypothetical protein